MIYHVTEYIQSRATSVPNRTSTGFIHVFTSSTSTFTQTPTAHASKQRILASLDPSSPLKALGMCSTASVSESRVCFALGS